MKGKVKLGGSVFEFDTKRRGIDSIPNEKEVERCFYYNERPKERSEVSYEELFNSLLEDNTEVFLFGVKAHQGKVLLANNGELVSGVTRKSLNMGIYKSQLQCGVLHVKRDNSLTSVHINVMVTKPKKDGTTSKNLVDISDCNVWSTSLEEAKLKFQKAKEEAVAIAKEQIEKEHSQKLEDLELFVKENLL